MLRCGALLPDVEHDRPGPSPGAGQLGVRRRRGLRAASDAEQGVWSRSGRTPRLRGLRARSTEIAMTRSARAVHARDESPATADGGKVGGRVRDPGDVGDRQYARGAAEERRGEGDGVHDVDAAAVADRPDAQQLADRTQSAAAEPPAVHELDARGPVLRESSS